MKNVRLGITLMFVCASLLFVRCTPEQIMASSTKQIISQGTWSVGYYFDGQDRTADYHGYTFTFNSSGTVSCADSSSTYTGTWSTAKDSGNNEVLTINLESAPTSLSALNDPWTIGSVALNSIGMKNANNTQLVMKKL